MTMEETIPQASNPASNGATSRRQAQHRIVSHSVNTHHTFNSRESDVDSDNGNDRSRNRRPRSLWLTLSFFVSKCHLMLTSILRFLLHPVHWFTNIALSPGDLDEVSGKAFAAYFQTSFLTNAVVASLRHDSDENTVLTHKNPFIEVSYSTVLSDVSNRTRNHESEPGLHPPPPLVLVYLHSPLHSEVPVFLSQTFCDPQIISELNRNIQNGSLLCWGGSIHTTDGATLQSSFGVTSYPFLALMRVQKPPSLRQQQQTPPSSLQMPSNNSNTRIEIQIRIEGPTLISLSPSTLHQYLSNSLHRHIIHLSEQATRRLQRADEIRLREEQDHEYDEALAMDRRREKEKAEQERLEEEAVEMVRLEKMRAEDEKKSKIDEARILLEGSGGEPKIGTDGSARMKFMLPSGQRIERRFRGMDDVGLLRAFLIIHFYEKDIPIESFQLSSNYPRKILSDLDSTLEGEGLCPQAVIMVQDLDA